MRGALAAARPRVRHDRCLAARATRAAPLTIMAAWPMWVMKDADSSLAREPSGLGSYDPVLCSDLEVTSSRTWIPPWGWDEWKWQRPSWTTPRRTGTAP